ncbi:hypothetical protein DCC81_19985 [Chitinophaga parva]|uniref:CN hydrolase domain-containing protein n=1 Tax=Chitinophaga parva TaxID=2169414 RepID=A0A2T7BC96_9BACT|nr:nitrilase-related carbon-nitrogen hydrolase [Chitinophaga parva]PUZ22714.1 hypothetical protein DCC81_19985 [Chitinophaga parva]
MRFTDTFFSSRIGIIASVLFSACCYYFGNGLTGDCWFLVWVAPLPLLCVAMSNSWKATLVAAFIAYALGRMSWFSYLERVAFLVPAIILTIVPALIFAAIILLTRWITLRTRAWYACFAFPVFCCLFEYALIRQAPDGTAGSIAYSQMNCLPLIQVAALGGILGITFLITLIPSALAYLYIFRNVKKQWTRVLVVTVVIAGGALSFGMMRLSQPSPGQGLQVGMAVIREDLHNTSDKPNRVKDSTAAARYVQLVDSLGAKGALVVVLPERALSIDKQSEAAMLDTLRTVAAKRHLYLVAGYTNLRSDTERNSALLVGNATAIPGSYNKVHLVNGLETQFTPGHGIGLFNVGAVSAGVAICKDLDFQDYMRQYGLHHPQVLFVPAWDFAVDDWLHARMAVLRSVENGFPMVRAARIGQLTISDCYGRVLACASTAQGQEAVLAGAVPLQPCATFYTKHGDWPGIVCMAGAAWLLLLAIWKPSSL